MESKTTTLSRHADSLQIIALKQQNKRLLAALKSKNKRIERLLRGQNRETPEVEMRPVLKSIIGRIKYNQRKYDSTLKNFGMALHFYSPNAHSFVRRNFLNCIPSKQQIVKWMSNLNIEPGFLMQCLQYLKSMTENPVTQLVVNLQMDEISIRKQVTSR